jgi:hypothetical protein
MNRSRRRQFGERAGGFIMDGHDGLDGGLDLRVANGGNSIGFFGSIAPD